MDSDTTRPTRPTPTSYVSAPFLWIDWICQWIAYLASNLAIFRVLEYVGKLGILVTVIWWVAEYPERQREAVRAAWSVVNAKGGGRKEALEYLAAKNVDLRGLYAANGYFSGIALERRDLSWSDLEDANFEVARLDGATLQGANLSGTDFKNATLVGAHIENSRFSPNAPVFDGADIADAYFKNIVIENAQVYLAFAQAINWDKAHFDQGVKEYIECMTKHDKKSSLCEPSIPNIQEVGGRVEGQRFIDAIIANIRCEVRGAFNDLRETYPNGHVSQLVGR